MDVRCVTMCGLEPQACDSVVWPTPFDWAALQVTPVTPSSASWPAGLPCSRCRPCGDVRARLGAQPASSRGRTVEQRLPDESFNYSLGCSGDKQLPVSWLADRLGGNGAVSVTAVMAVDILYWVLFAAVASTCKGSCAFDVSSPASKGLPPQPS